MNRLTLMTPLAIVAFISSCENSPQRQAEELIIKVEAFRTSKGYLPDSLAQLGLREIEEGPVYYRRETDTSFTVWYGRELGESRTYHSASQSWE